MIVLDASVLVAQLNSRDSHHPHATVFLSSREATDLVIHTVTLAEVLVGGVRIGRGDRMLRDVQTMGIRTLDRLPDEPLKLATLRARTGLKLPDCCALMGALVEGAGLATFDAELRRAGEELGVRVLPEE